MNGSVRYSTITNTADESQSNSGFGYNFNLSTSYKFTVNSQLAVSLGFLAGTAIASNHVSIQQLAQRVFQLQSV